MKILLMGNPNVGKSALFTRLTGIHTVCSNYPGTTVAYCKGTMPYKEGKAEIIDVPGTYSLDCTNKVEEVAVDMLEHGDIIINVIDATNLERNLYLTLELLEHEKPVIIALNMWDDTKHKGIEINLEKLEKKLGVPVIPTVAVTGQGIKELVEKIDDSKKAGRKKQGEKQRWAEIGEITGQSQTLHHRHHTLLERLEDASVKPATGIPIAVIMLVLTFYFIVNTGNLVIEKILDPFFYNIYGPIVIPLVKNTFGEGTLTQILIGQGEDFIESLGLLTTGIYVPLNMVLPFVILFYLSLSLLEDSGYLPRLATLMDTFMHRIGLHGYAIVPSILGLGCNVPGMLSTRILESEKQRFIAATLLAICIPCLAQNAIIIGLLSNIGLKYVLITYTTLLLLFILIGFTLNKIIPGETPEILMEVPPYRMPRLDASLKKTWMRVKHFLKDAVPYVLLGVLVINLVYVTGLINHITRIFGPLMAKLFGLPEEAMLALIVGFIRKDVAVGMLAPIQMSPEQLTIASTILAIYFPCIATYMVLFKELGLRGTIKSTMMMAAVSLIVGTILKTILL